MIQADRSTLRRGDAGIMLNPRAIKSQAQLSNAQKTLQIYKSPYLPISRSHHLPINLYRLLAYNLQLLFLSPSRGKIW